MDAPVHRLLALIDEPLVDETSERPDDCRLVFEVHRQVRMVPIAEDPEALELGRHDADEALRIGAAGPAEVRHAHLPLLRAELAVHLQLDGQPVTVITGHVRGVESSHRARLDDEVLQDLVERGAEVDLAVCVRRSVVEYELRSPGPGLANTVIESHCLPSRERLRLGGLEVRLHREICPREVKGVFPFGHARDSF